MPRASAESRAAAALRAGGVRPNPPAGLSLNAADEWRRIVASKPLGWFDAGSLPLLEAYCATLDRLRALHALLLETPPNEKGAAYLEQRIMGLNGNCATLATKLRLSVQSAVDRKSRMLDESGPGEEAAADPLLGGKVVQLRA